MGWLPGSGCVLWLQMDERQGNRVFDLSEWENHGTRIGALWRRGKVGFGLAFDGVDDYVEVPNSPSLREYPEGVTYELWFIQPMAQTSAGIMQQTPDPWVDLWIDEAKRLRYEVAKTVADTTYAVHVYSDVLEAGKWYHTVLAWSEVEHTLFAYLNGAFIGKATNINISATPNPNNLRVGEYFGYFNGTIDEVRVYNRVLSIEEIRSRYWYGIVPSLRPQLAGVR